MCVFASPGVVEAGGAEAQRPLILRANKCPGPETSSPVVDCPQGTLAGSDSEANGG